MGVQGNRDNRLRDAAILKDAPKPAARSDHQRDVAVGARHSLENLKNRLPVEAAHFAQGDKADQDRDQQGDIGTAQQDAARGWRGCRAASARRPSCRAASAPPAAEWWSSRWPKPGKLRSASCSANSFRHRVVRIEHNPGSDEAGINGAGHDRAWECRPAGAYKIVRPTSAWKMVNRQHGSRMRWHQARGPRKGRPPWAGRPGSAKCGCAGRR